MIRANQAAVWFSSPLILLAAAHAHAELRLCNRTSYQVEAAVGLEKRPNVTTRGWFRIDPGQCKQVVDGALDVDMTYVHVRTPPVYGSAPMPQTGQAELCVHNTDFVVANARNCAVSQQARFSAARPLDAPEGPTVNLAEEADYDDAQARLAGIQRLLAIAGYDAYPIDGVAGARTQAALAKFLANHKLPADANAKPEFFDTLLKAARNPEGTGFSWCNETKHTVMASLGIVEMGSIITRGWYRVEPDKCVRPDVRGEPHRFYSYGEAVDGDGRAIKRDDAPLAWGGKIPLCTRDGKFELSDHKDCAARGLNSAGFALIDTGGKPTMTVRFKDQ